MMSNKQTKIFFAADKQFALGYRPFFIMAVLIQAFHSKEKFLSRNTSSITLLDPKFYSD